MKKRAIGFLLASTLSLGLIGCSGKESGSDSSKADNPSKELTISIFQSKNSIIDQLEDMAAEYTELTGIKVEILGAPGENYLDNLRGKLTGKQGPTIFTVSEGTQLDILHSYLCDLSEEPYVSEIAEGMGLEYEGTLLGIPQAVEGYGMVCNDDLFGDTELKDFDSFQKFAEELSAKDVSLVELSDNSYFMLGHILNTPFAMQEDYRAYLEKLNAGEVKMSETPEFIEWAKFMEVIRDTSGNPMGITYDDQAADFMTGKAASIHQGNWVWLQFADYEAGFDISLRPFPLMGNEKICVGIPNAWVVNNQKSEEEIEAGKDFLEWMFTSERGQHYITEEFKFIPAMKNIDVADIDPLSMAVHEYVMEENTLPWTYNIWPEGMVTNQLAAVAQKFFSDTSMTGSEFLEELDKAWSAGVK